MPFHKKNHAKCFCVNLFFYFPLLLLESLSACLANCLSLSGTSCSAKPARKDQISNLHWLTGPKSQSVRLFASGLKTGNKVPCMNPPAIRQNKTRANTPPNSDGIKKLLVSWDSSSSFK